MAPRWDSSIGNYVEDSSKTVRIPGVGWANSIGWVYLSATGQTVPLSSLPQAQQDAARQSIRIAADMFGVGTGGQTPRTAPVPDGASTRAGIDQATRPVIDVTPTSAVSIPSAGAPPAGQGPGSLHAQVTAAGTAQGASQGATAAPPAVAGSPDARRWDPSINRWVDDNSATVEVPGVGWVNRLGYIYLHSTRAVVHLSTLPQQQRAQIEPVVAEARRLYTQAGQRNSAPFQSPNGLPVSGTHPSRQDPPVAVTASPYNENNPRVEAGSPEHMAVIARAQQQAREQAEARERERIAAAGPSRSASVESYMSALPAPNQIHGRNFSRLPRDTQDFVRSAYESKGYSANDVDDYILKGLPQFRVPGGPGRVR